MSATALYMSISLDGFVGPNQGPDNGLGDDGERLHDWSITDGTDDVEAARRLGASTARSSTSSGPPGRSSPVGGPSSLLTAGATTTTACRSSSSPAATPTTIRITDDG